MNPKQLALILAVVSAVTVIFTQVDLKPEVSSFESWQAKHNLKFESSFEKAYRERIFLENLALIEAHNSKADRTYDMGLNQFSAHTDEEFQQQYLGLTLPENFEVIADNNENFQVSDVDWNSKGYLTPVKNQGQCGSCWAFSATGGLEGLSKSLGDIQSFSEQQLVDCSGKYRNMACNGGLMDNAFKFVTDNGIVHESEYEYKAVKQTCKIPTGAFKISGFVDIKTCTKLANAISERPISVAVDATNWPKYSSGVFNNCAIRLNHGVLLAGVKDEAWVIKNSWGPTWGEQGFIRLAKGNTCGICNFASYPIK